MKKSILISLLMAAALVIGGCGDSDATEDDSHLSSDASDNDGWQVGESDAGDLSPDADNGDSSQGGEFDSDNSDSGDSDSEQTPNPSGSCPTAVATATIQGDSASQPATTVQAMTLSTIQFDASSSVSPDGAVARYEWTLLSAPSDSTELIAPADAVNPKLFLDVAGEYKVELVVYDAQDTVSCGTRAIITIESSYAGNDIAIQLTWSRPAGAEEGDGGVDMDLHYLHPNATAWGTQPFDCYYANKTPSSWSDDFANNPLHAIDDINGPGPEVVTHSNLEDLVYRVGAHYYSDHQLGPSDATVRVYRSGIEVFAHEDKLMTRGQFWDVARIDGGTLEISQIDNITEGYPELDPIN